MNDRDELAAARKKRKNKIRAKRVARLVKIAAAAAVVVLLASIVTMSTFKDFTDLFSTLFAAGEYPVVLSSDLPDQVDKISMGYCVRAGGEIIVLKNNGAVLQRITPSYNGVANVCGGNKIAVYHRGGREISLYNRTKLIYELETDNAIISCALGNGRLVAALCESDRYSGEVVVYNTDAEKVLTWYCAAGFPYIMAFDGDASHLAVGCAYIENGVVCTSVSVINVASRQEVATVQLSCAAVRLLPHNASFTAVGSSSVTVFDKNGGIVNRFEYGDRTLLMYAAESRDNIAVAFGDNSMSGINEVVWLDGELNQRCTLDVGSAIKDICVERGLLYLLGDHEITAYSVVGAVAKSFDIHYNAVAMVVSNRVIEIMPDTASVAESGGQ